MGKSQRAKLVGEKREKPTFRTVLKVWHTQEEGKDPKMHKKYVKVPIEEK